MPSLHTDSFGRLDYDPESTLEFSEGLPGFESEHSFLLVERPQNHPLVFLQSILTPELCFPALPIHVVDRGYRPCLGGSDLELLGFTQQPSVGEDAVVLVLIAIHGQEPTANLLAPVIINLNTRAAAQCIDPETRYSHRHPLLPVFEAAS